MAAVFEDLFWGSQNACLIWGAPKGQLTTCTIFPETRLISKARIVFSRIRKKKSVFLKITGRGILLGGTWVKKKKNTGRGGKAKEGERRKGGKETAQMNREITVCMAALQ